MTSALKSAVLRPVAEKACSARSAPAPGARFPASRPIRRQDFVRHAELWQTCATISASAAAFGAKRMIDRRRLDRGRAAPQRRERAGRGCPAHPKPRARRRSSNRRAHRDRGGSGLTACRLNRLFVSHVVLRRHPSFAIEAFRARARCHGPHGQALTPRMTSRGNAPGAQAARQLHWAWTLASASSFLRSARTHEP